MPFIASVGVARVTLDFISIQGNDAHNVLHVLNSTGVAWDAAQLGAMVDVFDNWLTTEWATDASQDWQADLITAVALDEEFGIVDNKVIAVTGAQTSEALPSQNTVAISFRSGFIGRSRRGRLYHVGMHEAAVEGDYILPVYGTALVTAYQALINLLADDSYFLGVLSYIENGAPRVTPLFTPYTTAILVNLGVDSMDKRKPG